MDLKERGMTMASNLIKTLINEEVYQKEKNKSKECS